MDRARLAQRGHGKGAAFELCRGDACPQRTTKTLSEAQGPTSSPVAPPALTQGVTSAVPDRGSEERIERSAPSSSLATSPTPALEAPVLQQLTLHFPFASARLDTPARAALREAAPRLAQAQEITLNGRTDSTGPAAANDWLARSRAQAVLRELLMLAPGIASRVRVEAQGDCCFVEANDSPAGRARNRRVEIRYRFDIDDPP